jgi:hypothetical protein
MRKDSQPLSARLAVLSGLLAFCLSGKLALKAANGLWPAMASACVSYYLNVAALSASKHGYSVASWPPG